jgi:hypothetical protein
MYGIYRPEWDQGGGKPERVHPDVERARPGCMECRSQLVNLDSIQDVRAMMSTCTQAGSDWPPYCWPVMRRVR